MQKVVVFARFVHLKRDFLLPLFSVLSVLSVLSVSLHICHHTDNTDNTDISFFYCNQPYQADKTLVVRYIFFNGSLLIIRRITYAHATCFLYTPCRIFTTSPIRIQSSFHLNAVLSVSPFCVYLSVNRVELHVFGEKMHTRVRIFI